MTDHDLIREAREHWWPDEAATTIRQLADALKAAVARANQLEKALGLLGGAVELHHNYGDERHPGCGVCDALANAEATLAGVPAEPATEEKP